MDQNQLQYEQGRPEKGQQNWNAQGQQGQDDSQQRIAERGLQTTAEVALRGAAMLWDLQMETARNLMRTHARTAAMLGVPDYSEFFRVGDEHARRIMSVSAEQVLNSARQARDTVVEVQRHIGRLAEQQVTGLTEEVRKQIEQMGRQTEQRLQELRQLAVTQADQVNDAARQAIDAVAQARRQSAQPQQRGADDQQAPQPGVQSQPSDQQAQRADQSEAQPVDLQPSQPLAQQAERTELWVPAGSSVAEVEPQGVVSGHESGIQADPAQGEQASALILPETIESRIETPPAGKQDGLSRDGDARGVEDRPRSRRASV